MTPMPAPALESATVESPAATEEPVAPPQNATSTGPADDAMTASDFPVPPERDLRLLAQQMRWNGAEPPGAAFVSEDLQVGEVRDFWTLDYPSMAMVSNRFRLAAISDGAYWWVGEDAKVETEALSRTLEEAEGQVFPRVEKVFADGSGTGSLAHHQRKDTGSWRVRVGKRPIRGQCQSLQQRGGGDLHQLAGRCTGRSRVRRRSWPTNCST